MTSAGTGDLLGHVVVETRDVEAWRDFLTRILGLEEAAPVADGDGAVGFAMDDLAARIFVTGGERDEIVAIGVTTTADRLERIRSSLGAAHIDIDDSAPAVRASRRVLDLSTFDDPDGLRIELCASPEVARDRYVTDLVPGGFVTGRYGIGHVVVWSADREGAGAWYRRHLGWEMTGTLAIDTPRGPVLVDFLACNERHHTLALGSRPPGAPTGPRTGHLMVEVASVDGLGMILDRVLAHEIPITRSLGRHYGDGMLSFYVATPSGFELEIGTGAVPAAWPPSPRLYRSPSVWGHRMAARP
jgi:3,4-dihydroxy-9,10-secoandrosta-1,3,5(10)-triene-9,17-dione 4,5-dioxygenase